MDIKEKQRLAEKQKFWAEQLPNFEAKYWLPSHFAVLVFDMTQGNYVIKDGIHPDFEDDATEIYHRVNTGWAMWKKAITFSQKQAQAVPEGFALVSKELNAKEARKHAEVMFSKVENMVRYEQRGLSESEFESFKNRWLDARTLTIQFDWKAMIEAQEPAND